MPVRNFTWDDLSALLDFVEMVKSGESYGRELRRRVFRETLAEPGLAPEENCFLFVADGHLQGFCRVRPELAIGRTMLELESVPHTPPSPKRPRGDFHEGGTGENPGSPVERNLVRRGVARSGDLAARVAHICLPAGSPTCRFLEEEGFSQVRIYWDMAWHQKALPQPALPQGFSLRHFQAGDEQPLTDLQNAAFAGSWGFCPNTVEQIRYRTRMSNTQPEGILFLCHGEQLAGYCWTRVAQPRGFIDMIGVAPDYRNRGLSRPVLLAAMAHLRSVGVADIGLHVDSSNTPAISLYLSVGFEKVKELHWFQFDLPPIPKPR